MKRITCLFFALALMIGGLAQIQIPGGPIRPPVPPEKQRQKPKPKPGPKKTTTQKVKYYDVIFTSNAYDGDLYIDGEYVDDANTTYPLKAGSHKVKVVTDYYYDYSTTINVSASNKSFDLNLTEKTDSESQYRLGINYHEGRFGFPKDYTETAKHFLYAADKGHIEAQNWLGCCYFFGEGVTHSETEAAKWYRKSAEQGNVYAQSLLGLMYEVGVGVTKNETEAVKWYRLAAEQGFDEAQYQLGQCYGQGIGLAKDEDEAAKWYRLAADQGLAKAQYSMGYCYMSALGVPSDDT